jgi:hypothetical protein
MDFRAATRRWPFLVAAAALGLSGRTALGAVPAAPGNQPIAEALFAKAKASIEAGRYQEGCAELAESHRLDPAPGTLLSLAVCHELEGKLASAWAEYREVLALAQREGHAEREHAAKKRLGALEPRLPYLTISLSRVLRQPGIAVAIDGVPLRQSAWETPLPVDPGERVVRVSAPGRLDWIRSVEMTEGGRRTLEVERLLAAPAPIAKDPHPDSPPRSAVVARRVGYGAVGVAVLSAAVSAYFGLRAQAAWAERNRHCVAGRCDAHAVEAGRDAKRFATVADGALAWGVLHAAAGVYLIVAPGSAPSAPSSRAARSFLITWGGQL